MNTGTCKGLDAQSWKDLYQIAMCESDVNKLPERIADAEGAIVLRARQLFYTSGDSSEEQESLDDALCILHARLRQHSILFLHLHIGDTIVGENK